MERLGGWGFVMSLLTGKVDPGIWLRRRPSTKDSPAEFVRDFAAWSRAMRLQEGFSWQEFEWFVKRAEQLERGTQGRHDVDPG